MGFNRGYEVMDIIIDLMYSEGTEEEKLRKAVKTLIDMDFDGMDEYLGINDTLDKIIQEEWIDLFN